MNSPMRSSSSHALQGPRPSPLAINPSSAKISKTKTTHPRPPVVVYLRSPKVIHVRPEEFMGLVQQLTGNRSSSTSTSTHRNNNNNNNLNEKRVGDGFRQNLINSANINVEAANFGGPTKVACSSSPSTFPPSGFGGEFSLVTAFDIPMC